MAGPVALHAAEDTVAEIPGRGTVIAVGDSVPADNAKGYSKGCVFAQLDTSSTATVLYVNIGTESAANFDPVASGAISSVDTLTMNDAGNIVVGSTTGTKIGTATAQKLGFWNATPIVQPSGAAQAAVTPSTDFTGADTVDKATVLAAVQAVETLANALRTALVNAGLIKGAA